MSRKPSQAALSHRALELKQTAEVERLLSFDTVCALTSWSRPSIYRLMKADKFPKPVGLGDHRVAFKESEIQAYIASRTSR